MTGMNGSPPSVMPPTQPHGIWTTKAALWGSSATMPESASISDRHCSPGWKNILPTPTGQSWRPTGRVSPGAPAMGPPWPRFITISSCPWLAWRDKRTQVRWGIRDFEHRFSALPRRDVAGGNRRGYGNIGGFGRGRHPFHHPRSSPGGTGSQDRRSAAGRMSPAHASTLPGLISAGFPLGEVSPSSSTTAPFPRQWPSKSC